MASLSLRATASFARRYTTVSVIAEVCILSDSENLDWSTVIMSFPHLFVVGLHLQRCSFLLFHCTRNYHQVVLKADPFLMRVIIWLYAQCMRLCVLYVCIQRSTLQKYREGNGKFCDLPGGICRIFEQHRVGSRFHLFRRLLAMIPDTWDDFWQWYQTLEMTFGNDTRHLRWLSGVAKHMWSLFCSTQRVSLNLTDKILVLAPMGPRSNECRSPLSLEQLVVSEYMYSTPSLSYPVWGGRGCSCFGMLWLSSYSMCGR